MDHRSQVIGVHQSPPSGQVYQAGELVLSADGNLHGHWHRTQPIPDHLHRTPEVGPEPIHLVNEANAWHAIPVGLPPDRLRLWFHAGHSIEDHHPTIQHPEAPLHLRGEVNVSWGVYDVNLMLVPEAGHCGRSDGDSSFPLLLHPIGDGGAIIHVPHAMSPPGIEEHPLCRGGLARVNVGDHSDVSNPFQRTQTSHRVHSTIPIQHSLLDCP